MWFGWRWSMPNARYAGWSVSVCNVCLTRMKYITSLIQSQRIVTSARMCAPVIRSFVLFSLSFQIHDLQIFKLWLAWCQGMGHGPNISEFAIEWNTTHRKARIARWSWAIDTALSTLLHFNCLDGRYIRGYWNHLISCNDRRKCKTARVLSCGHGRVSTKEKSLREWNRLLK